MHKYLLLIFFIIKFLPFQAQQPTLMIPIGHSWVEIVKFSPDNKFLISSSDKELFLWDFASRKLLVKLFHHTRRINSISFSPDGKYFVTASNDSTAKIWEIKTGNLLYTLRDSSGGIRNALFSPDGHYLATYTSDLLKIWDVKNNSVIKDSIGKWYRNTTSAVFSPDSKYLLQGEFYRSVLYSVPDGKEIKVFDDKKNPHQYEKIFALFSNDGKKMLSAGDRTAVKLWDVSTGLKLLDLKGHEYKITKAIFSPDDKKIITVSEFFEPAFLWDAGTGNLIAKLTGHKELIESVSFSPDGSKIVTSSRDGTAKIWDAKSGDLLFDLNKHRGEVSFADFSPDGKYIATASEDETIKIWTAQNGNLAGDLRGHSSELGKSFAPMISDTMFSVVNNKVLAWNTKSGILSGYLSANNTPISCIARSYGGDKIVTGDTKGIVRIWDARTLSLTHTIKNNKDYIFSITFSQDDKRMAVASSDSTAQVLQTETWNLLSSFKLNDKVISATLSKSGDKLITLTYANKAHVWDLNTISMKYELVHKDWIRSVAFSPDDKFIASCSGNYLLPKEAEIKIWNATEGKLKEKYSLTENLGLDKIFFSPDGNFVISTSIDGILLIAGTKSNKLKWKSARNNSQPDVFQQLSFSPDNTQLISASRGRSVNTWQLKKAKLVLDLKGHTDYVNAALCTPDGKYIITVSGDNTSKKWNASTGELLCTFIAIDNNEYFTQVPSGYYQTSSNTAKLLHYVTKDLKIITFEQLDVKYNRPDKVLEAIGNTDTALIKSYRKAWEKRIKKLGIDTTAFRDGYSVPEADIVNRDSIDYEQKTGTLRLHIKGIDSTYKLDRFNIWVNETPLYGQRGIRIRKKNSNILDTTIIIFLSQGENRIETSITNVNETESYRMPLYVNYTPAVRQKESVRFIGIGIDQFKESQHNLQYSSKDIRDLALKLKEKYKDNITIDTLFNENVTTEKVKALKEKLQQTSVNDKVILSYSGHGLLSRDYDYYLSTYSVNFNKPEENGMPYDEIESLLDSIPARKKLMLIDACHSGEVDKEEGIAMNKLADSLGLSKGIIIDQVQSEQHVGLKNSFELMQSLFVNVGKSTGATIISAAAGNQFALERGDLKNGVFTYSILEAMSKYPTLKISELKRIVGDRVQQLTNGLQKPTSRNENISVDWELW